LAALKLADIEASYFSVRDDGWEKGFEEEADLIVAAGGDGTIARVLRTLPDRSVPVALLPLGTANNVARSLGIAGTPQERVETWKLDRTFPLNLGAIKGITENTVFLEGFGVGVLGEFLRRAKKKKKPLGADNLRLGRETLQKVLKDAEVISLELTVDDKQVR